jgi:hypothetical protein
VRVLVTSSRTPFAIDLIRKLAERGEEVWASDTYETAPGSHSRYLAGHLVTASPQHATARFVEDVAGAVREHGIEVIVPAFEECFYLATARERLAPARVYTGPFPVLARLHDKASFQRLAAKLGLPTPETVVARSDDQLKAALGRFPRYFARAAFSRGGVDLLTNNGPLAGAVDPDDVHPSEDSPWLVQEFVDGPMVCTYSTLHEGRVTAHCTYEAPRQWHHSTAIEFRSVDGGPSLEVVQRLGSELGYTGQLSFDFVRSEEGLRLIECNPRATDGVLLMSADELGEGLLWPDAELALVEPGRMVELELAVVGQMLTEGPRQWPRSIRDLVHVRDASAGWRDHLPLVYSFLAFVHHADVSVHQRRGLLEVMADDMVWNGEPIEGMSEADAAALREIEAARPAG